MVLTQTTKHYLSNLDAGYTPIPNLNDERKIGIYGLKAKVFTLVVVLLLIFSLVNFMVSVANIKYFLLKVKIIYFI